MDNIDLAIHILEEKYPKDICKKQRDLWMKCISSSDFLKGDNHCSKELENFTKCNNKIKK